MWPSFPHHRLVRLMGACDVSKITELDRAIKRLLKKPSRAPEDQGARGRETGVYAGYMRILSRRATPGFQAQ